MTLTLETLNGVQLGLLLFLIAAGLTLVFGVMDFINLAHGVQYMLGAYLGVAFAGADGQSSGSACCWRCRPRCAFGLALEWLVFRHLYGRDHLDQVLATFGVIIFAQRGRATALGLGAAAAADARRCSRARSSYAAGCAIRSIAWRSSRAGLAVGAAALAAWSTGRGSAC